MVHVSLMFGEEVNCNVPDTICLSGGTSGEGCTIIYTIESLQLSAIGKFIPGIIAFSDNTAKVASSVAVRPV